MAEESRAEPLNGSEIAIIGMSCRLPGAADVEQFWRNLAGGVESLTLLTDEELERAGVDPRVYRQPNYVRRVSVLDGVEMFDPAFFGYTPLEAKVMDPQHRLFLECAWEVFEAAGYDPETYPSPVGVFTGAKTNTYLFSLFSNRAFFGTLDNFQIALGNDLASMATRVSYKLNLRGPSYALHTACSTSLVAVHLACQSLLLDECRMAVAGGAAVNVPHRKGYVAQKGGILSPDGSCRTFDEGAQGSNFGNGAGAVLLKRLEDALADGDHVVAVIRGSATNNDGARKASYTAPGVEGQTAVLLEAMACSGVEPGDLSYIEAHGTATDLGDSIEMLALADAFRAGTTRKHFCAIGSVKTNIGHLETAAGIAGLIKTALALERRQIPPSLHFTRPNPKIDFANSPFYVNTELAEWRTDGRPRRAGLSSFGIGSTNAHVILEEPPAPVATTPPVRPFQLLTLSARTETALDAMTANLVRHLEENPAVDLADVAYTLHVGRKGFQQRRAVVVRDTAEAVAALRAAKEGDEAAERSVVFLFPGLGEQSVDMGLGLYQTEPVFRAALHRCAELLSPELGVDLRELLYPRGTDPAVAEEAVGADPKRLFGRAPAADDPASRRLQETRFAQPAIFAVEYALAKLWLDWGIHPRAMIGYSVGEYVAACLSGVLSLEDALRLVARRARLIQELPAGSMTAVPLAEEEVAPLLARHGLSLAALNGPVVSVAAGPEEAVSALERELEERGTVCRHLPTTHAFHSSMMEPLSGALTELARTVERKAPQIPYLSNVTGTWITGAEATDAGYWARHMCGTVLFADGLRELLTDGTERVFLEVGPGQSLGSFVRLHPDCGKEWGRLVVPSMRAAHGGKPSGDVLLGALGQLWSLGVPVDWKAFHAGERRRRVPLPTYPFERQAYWVDPDGFPQAAAETEAARHVTLDKQADVADWFYRPVWKSAPVPEAAPAAGSWLILADRGGLGEWLAERLRGEGRTVRTVEAGEGPVDYAALLGKEAPAGIIHLWSLDAPSADTEESFQRSQELGFHSLLSLVQAAGRLGLRDTLRLTVVSSGIFAATGREALAPERATLVGPCRVIPQEIARVTCRLVDLDIREQGEIASADQIVAELAEAPDSIVALRGGERLVQDFEGVRLEAPEGPARLRERGVYLLTGGLGGLGLTLAEYLARTVQARLVLTGRSPLPAREEWANWLESHPQDDPASARIRAVLGLEELGAEVLAVSADVTDETAMRALVAEARRRFGRIDGVVHLAGTPGGGILQLKTREAAERIMAPKVRGARVLDAIFREEPPDFLVLFSSIASILGEFGQVDYCGANAFLDAVAERNVVAGGPFTVTINWDIWREVGLAVYTEVPAHLKPWRQEMLEKAILNTEGVDAFARILGAGLPHVVVSAQELHGRIELGKSFTGESFLRELEKAGGAPARPVAAASAPALGAGGLERRIAEIWQRVLGGGQVGLQDNFFDLGGNSLLGLQIVSEMSRDLGVEVAPVVLFESPTVSALARHLAPPAVAGEQDDELAERRRRARGGTGEGAGTAAIAIIGMAGRFPGAPDTDALWRNLRAGVESVTFFTDEELLAAGADPEVLKDPRYVQAGSILDGIDLFDAGLFGYSPREAEVMDPQHRIFLECAWELFDKAGWDPETFPGRIGVFAGSNLSTYLLRMYADPDVRSSVNMLQAILGNDKDSLTTTVSYKLNLRGPSVAVQTFCSTSLVAVHMACQSLRQGECDMAMAGGIRVVVPDHQGYVWEPGGIAPSDGHSRSFDAKANGSILGHGVGAVLLKRLDDALADGDHVHAVIRGTAINNDGSLKAGYTAPSVAGQAEAIAAVFEEAGIDPSSIGYVEAHGSATELGDPIEVTALTRAFRRWTDARSYCPIGSVKSNFGHLDRAAGVTGLIKAVLALEHGEIPPSINFDEPNPQIDFANSPFFVNTKLRSWKPNGTPRRAAVNSLGMGGTNAHLILEEAPPAEPSGPSRPWQLLVLSARSESALDRAAQNLASHLESHPDLSLADSAFTLQAGRRGLEHRRMVVCRDLPDAVSVLRGGDPRRVLTAWREEGERPVVFLFSGLGGQYVNMGRCLYESEPTFRAEVDRCCEELQPLLGIDLRTVIYPEDAAGETGGSGVDLHKMLRRGGDGPGQLDETRFAQPALFVLEYALARLWMEWGIRPQALAGYSVGEYVAACLAGVLPLSGALALVAERARRIQDLPGGAMLAVGLPEEEVLPLLGTELSLAAVNGPEQTVVAGPVAAVEELESRLAAREVASRRLAVTHAFHSRMMEPAFDALVERVRGVALSPPQIPLLSNLSGRWMTAEEATDPTYWSRHMCGTVRFSESAAELLSEPDRVFLEIGPGPTLASLILQHPAARRDGGRETVVLPTVRHSYETQPDAAYALTTLGKLWLLGARVDWAGFYAHERRQRVVLPAYPFERQRYWIDTVVGGAAGRRRLEGSGPRLYTPSWKRSKLPTSEPAEARSWLILADSRGLGDRIAGTLLKGGAAVAVVRPGEVESWAEFFDGLGGVPDRIVHLWSLGEAGFERCRELSFAAPLELARELAVRGGAVQLWAIADGLLEVDGDEELRPEAAILLGACRAISEHLPQIDCRAIDVPPLGEGSAKVEKLAERLLAEFAACAPERLIAYRGSHRWVPVLDELPAASSRSPQGVVCLLAGGLEEPGHQLARYLARNGARLLLLEPAGFPAREEWEEWLRGDAEGLIGRRLAKVRDLEALGAEVEVAGVDLADEAAVNAAVEAVEQRWGPLQGLILAGSTEAPSPEGALADGNGHLGARVRGALALDALRRRRNPDFAFLVAPRGTGAGAVTAAEAFFLDTLAAASGAGWTSVAWGLGAGADGELDRLFGAGSTAQVTQVVASSRPLHPGWSPLEGLPEEESGEVRASVGYYPRPSLRVDFVPPRNATEEYVATIWKDLLGVAQVGVHDNFLDLGGDSLLATRLVSRMRDVFHLDLPVRLFFERSTVAELAEAVEELKAQLQEEQEAELLQRVQTMSEEDLEKEIMRLESLLAEEEVANG